MKHKKDCECKQCQKARKVVEEIVKELKVQFLSK